MDFLNTLVIYVCTFPNIYQQNISFIIVQKNLKRKMELAICNIIVHTTFYIKDIELEVIPAANFCKAPPIFLFSFERGISVTTGIGWLITQTPKEIYMFYVIQGTTRLGQWEEYFPFHRQEAKSWWSLVRLKRGKNLEKLFNFMLKEGTTCKLLLFEEMLWLMGFFFFLTK